MKEKMEMLKKVIKEIGMENEIEVNEGLVYSMFGENLDVENTEEELKEIFLFEL